ncbi:MAG: hypothetical protein QW613_04625 [Thermoprotei archaeon]
MIVVPSMPKRFKFEVVDDNGNKIVLGLEGYFSQEQVERLLRLVSEITEIKGLQQRPFDESTIFGRVASLINDISTEEWVSSGFIRDAYQKRFGESIGLPVISTYLARLCKMGYLERKGGSRRMVYRLVKAKRSDQAQY